MGELRELISPQEVTEFVRAIESVAASLADLVEIEREKWEREKNDR